MAQAKAVRGKKLVAKTLLYGALSAAMYAAVFTHTTVIMAYFTKGLYYAALPILTALAFSFVHGAFAGNVWSLLGIEAIQKRPQPRPTAQPRPAATRRPRVRAQMST